MNDRHPGLVLAAVLLSASACTGPAEVSDETDSDAGPECSPLIREPYCFLWDLDSPCADRGPRLHRLTGPGTLSEDNPVPHLLVGVYGNDEIEDFRDELAVTATRSTYTPEQVGCTTCEVVLELRFTEVDVESGWAYAGKGEIVAIDYLGPDGEPYEDAGFVGTSFRLNGDGGIQRYGAPDVVGTFEPESDDAPLPARIEWVFRGASGVCGGRW